MLSRGLPASLTRVLAALTGLYGAGVLAAGLLFFARGARVGHIVAAAGTLVAGATGAALAVGHVGPARWTTIHHASIVQQLPGRAGSMVLTQAVAESPRSGPLLVRAELPDATLTTRGGVTSYIDEEGRPILSDIVGLGARRAFALEGFAADLQPLAVETTGNTVRVWNRSSLDLRHCRFGEGSPETGSRELPPGAALEAQDVSEGAGPLLTCMTSVPPIPMTRAGADVRVTGDTVVALFRDPRTSDKGRQ
jgi:hypothetical protein